MQTFSQLDLDENILKALTACGYTVPTPIQARSIPEILQGHDVVASAQTGTGKTAAFVLPALHLLATEEAVKKPRVLILTPTRELASQITTAAHKYGKFLRFNIISILGGMSYHTQIRDLQRGADVIVATPGRLMDHMENGRVDLSGVRMLVLDEADRMLDMGFVEDIQHIAKKLPKDRQTLLFSATLDNQLATITRTIMKSPKRIEITAEKMAPSKIKQIFYKATNMQHKTRMLKTMLADEAMFKAIIFTATKMHADKLTAELRDQGFSAAALHGDLRQNVRTRTVDQLRRGRIQFLVATDVAARGIDINDVTHVINYDLPKFSEDYVHRIGRTGRAGKEGIAISFISQQDVKHLQRIERYLGEHVRVRHYEGDLTAADSVRPAREIEEEVDEKPAKRFDRGGNSGKRFDRDGKAPRRFDRDDKPARPRRDDDRPARPRRDDDRPAKRFDRDERPARPRRDDDRPAKRFSRDDKPARPRRDDDRPAKRFSRDDKPARPRRDDDRPARPRRDDDRPAKRFSRDDKPARPRRDDDRPAKRFSRDDKPARPRRDDDRPARPRRDDDRPAKRFSRDDKPARPRRDDDRPSRPRRDDDRPAKRFDRDEKPARKSAAPKKNVWRKDDSAAPAKRKTGSDSSFKPFKRRSVV